MKKLVFLSALLTLFMACSEEDIANQEKEEDNESSEIVIDDTTFETTD